MTAPGAENDGVASPSWDPGWGALAPTEVIPVVTTYDKSKG